MKLTMSEIVHQIEPGSNKGALNTPASTSNEQAAKEKAMKQIKAKKEKEPTTWLPEQYPRGESFDPYYNQGTCAN